MTQADRTAQAAQTPPHLIELKDSDELYGGAVDLVEKEFEHVDARPQRPKTLKIRTGLAISGGGIRSASFALGLLQALAEKRRLSWFDYLSTVSGGGYIGSAMTWMLHRGWKAPQGWDPGNCKQADELQFGSEPPCFPFTSPAGKHSRGTMGRIHSALLRHLRQNGKYLTPGQGLTIGSLAAVVLRGSLVSLFVYLPLLILSMLVVALYVVTKLPQDLPGGWAGFAPVVLVVMATGLAGLGITGVAWYRRSVQASLTPERRWEDFRSGLWPHVYKPALYVTAAGAVAMVLIKGAGVGDFDQLFRFAAILTLIGAVLSLFYAALSSLSSTMSRRWYQLRRWFEIGMGALLGMILLVLLFASLPLVDEQLACYLSAQGKSGNTGALGAIIATLGAAFSGSSYLETIRTKVRKLPLAIQVWLGAGLLVYGLMLLAYDVAVSVYESISALYGAGASFQHLGAVWDQLLPGGESSALFWFSAWLLLALLLARFTNVNYLSVHRYYRDRLMETFMPEPARVMEKDGPETPLANEARLSAMCRWDLNDRVSGPYHLVNTNVLLVNSKVPKFKARGGDSFILSPLYCGSDATRWLPTEEFMNNHMSLATAMAISGAAANPNAGVGGEGATRNPALSFLMSLLNIRLGFWAPNPGFPGTPSYPDLQQPGLGELLRYDLDENGRYVQLSDGGHFENLAVYELIRRQVDLILCSDAGADEEFNFGDLGNLVEKIRVDFGALIEFDKPLSTLVPAEDGGTAEQGYLVGRITYRMGKAGRFVYIKSTWLEKLSADLVAYKKQYPSFPDQSTADQFFSERQFEAYRELGYETTWRLLEDLGDELFKPVKAAVARTAKKTAGKKAVSAASGS